MRALFRLQKYIVALLFITVICGMILGIALVTNIDLGGGILSLFRAEIKQPGSHGLIHKNDGNEPSKNDNDQPGHQNSDLIDKLKPEPNQDQEVPNFNQGLKGDRPLVKVPVNIEDTKLKFQGKMSEPAYNVHIFYYPWYGAPKVDGKYLHWNHQYLPHWDKIEKLKWPTGRHSPPDDIGSNFYPELGPYSSRDPSVIENHMQQIRSTGAGVLAVSWYPPGDADNEGHPSDDVIPMLLDAAEKYSLKICFHIEPYKHRSAVTMRKQLKYIVRKYGKHPAFYRHRYRGKDLPLYYIYDSYQVDRDEWAKIFTPKGSMTVRSTELDGIFIGLIVQDNHKTELSYSGFDGYYTYFASDGFTYGSRTRNWAVLSGYARANDLIFIPSVGPGYIDTRVRPWNMGNTRKRDNGHYYEHSFKAAVAQKPPIVSITSFNEWHEGTQIEKSVPKEDDGFRYLDFNPNPSDFYLSLTRKWVFIYRKQMRS